MVESFFSEILHDAVLSERIHMKESVSGFYRYAENNPTFIIWKSGEDTLSVFSAAMDQRTERADSPLEVGKKTGIHQHKDIEILYVISGTFSQNIAGKDYDFEKRDVVLINRSIPHYDYIPSRDTCVLFLSIPNTLFLHLFQHSTHSPYKNFIADLLLQHRSDYTHVHGSPKPQVLSEVYLQTEHSLIEICREIAHTQPGSSHIIRGNIIRLIYHLALEYHFNLSDYSQADMRKLLYDEITADIKKDCRDITIESLQKKYFYNRDYFNRLIKEYSGYTFRELRQKIRLEKAKQMLLETDARIEDIALAVGYENQGFFYRLFAEKYQQTPREFRINER